MDDVELVRRAQAGDTGAFGELVERHEPRIHATLVKITGDADLALDLGQDAFIRAWEKLSTFRGDAAFSTWLYRIAVRLAYDEIGRRKRIDDIDLDHDVRDPAPGPAERAATEEAAEDVRRRVARLPDMQRAVVVMRAWDGLPYVEIAEILGTTTNSARVSFHHAITKLRQEIVHRTPTGQETPTE